MDDIFSLLAPMMFGEELESAMKRMPAIPVFNNETGPVERLTALNDIYSLFVPNEMSREIYSKMYMALLRSLKKKNTKEAVGQYYENYKKIIDNNGSGIIGGADSFTIIGPSGIGKSSAVKAVIDAISSNIIIETEEPFVKIIPFLEVQCPYDCSVKGLLVEILRKVDEILETNYLHKSQKIRATTDMLIGSVSNVCLNHIGVVIIDEIQNVVAHKHGKMLVAALMQIINASGISICMVGTPECKPFFEQVFQLARRSVGLEFSALKYKNFADFCEQLFFYQFTEEKTELNDALIKWLFNITTGNLSILITLFHDAQETAILKNRKKITIELLAEVFEQRLGMLRNFYEIPSKKTYAKKSASKKTEIIPQKVAGSFCEEKIENLEFILKSNSSITEKINELKAVIYVKELELKPESEA